MACEQAQGEACLGARSEVCRDGADGVRAVELTLRDGAVRTAVFGSPATAASP